VISSERGDKLALALKEPGKGAELKQTLGKLFDLVEKTATETPSSEDIEALERLLEENPSLWFLVFDLADMAEEQILQRLPPLDRVRVGLKTRLKELRRELGYEGASALERLLIEQVALCWLQHHLTEALHAEKMKGTVPLSYADFLDRTLAASQRRYLRACETLARIRKLTRSTLQVNIGERQINVAGDMTVSRKVEPEDVRAVAQELPGEE